ncbi:MAG: DUF3169 family protein [Eubacteriales bacterium]|nr:DUF3169 family protein [Eubacteriales bacterium]
MYSEKKKMNTYAKVSLKMLISAGTGGVAGLLGAWFFFGHDVKEAMTNVTEILQMMILPALLVLMAVSVFLGERSIRNIRKIHEKMKTAQDEEYDLLDYEEERTGGKGMIANVFSQALCFIILSFGYSMEYIASSDHNRSTFLYACIVWMVCFGYDCFWQIRYVKLLQKAHPEIKADPSSRKFQQQWLESCDEAEREIIYQSSYKTYMLLNKSIPVLLLLTMLTHMFLETGVLAVIVVAAIWLMETICYTRSCVFMRKSRIN